MFIVFVALKRAVGSIGEVVEIAGDSALLGAGVLGDGLGALGHGVLGQLAGEDESDRSGRAGS